MIAKIEVWFDRSYKYWVVAFYNEENNQIEESQSFNKKSYAVNYAKSLLPKLYIETRKGNQNA